jgi:hypothetical protein
MQRAIHQKRGGYGGQRQYVAAEIGSANPRKKCGPHQLSLNFGAPGGNMAKGQNARKIAKPVKRS